MQIRHPTEKVNRLKEYPYVPSLLRKDGTRQTVHRERSREKPYLKELRGSQEESKVVPGT